MPQRFHHLHSCGRFLSTQQHLQQTPWQAAAAADQHKLNGALNCTRRVQCCGLISTRLDFFPTANLTTAKKEMVDSQLQLVNTFPKKAMWSCVLTLPQPNPPKLKRQWMGVHIYSCKKDPPGHIWWELPPCCNCLTMACNVCGCCVVIQFVTSPHCLSKAL